MNRSIKISSLEDISDYSLYNLVKKYAFRELLGFTHNQKQFDTAITECKKRRKGIYQRASEDAFLDFLISKDEEREIQRTLSLFFASSEEIENIAPEIKKLLPNAIDFSRYDIYNVSGDSMINAGIKDGDHVLVDTLAKAKEDDIIVAIYIERIFIKRYKEIDGNIYLFSENPKFSPFKVYNRDNLKILGVVKFKISDISSI